MICSAKASASCANPTNRPILRRRFAMFSVLRTTEAFDPRQGPALLNRLGCKVQAKGRMHPRAHLSVFLDQQWLTVDQGSPISGAHRSMGGSRMTPALPRFAVAGFPNKGDA